MKTVVIIPAYNEEKTIRDVVQKTKEHISDVIVIDDGSRDDTARRARDAGAMIYRHEINRGLGAAIGTGFDVACRLESDIVVTMDADGQHDANLIATLTQSLRDGTHDVAIGVREKDRVAMPLHRKLGNYSGNIVTWAVYGIWARDSQSGFRALTRSAIERMKLKGDRMEVSSEILGEVSRLGLRLQEVPIEAIYTEYSLSKGQGLREGLRTLVRLMARKFFS